MQNFVIVLACLACGCNARRSRARYSQAAQVAAIDEPADVSQLASLLLATEATGFNAPITPRVRSLAASSVAQARMAEEKKANTAAIGAAALAAALDVGLFEADLPSATIVALVAAYATTLN